MSDLNKGSEEKENRVHFTSDSDLLEINEEDTKPGKVSHRYRKWLKEKWRKAPPNGPAEGTNGS